MTLIRREPMRLCRLLAAASLAVLTTLPAVIGDAGGGESEGAGAVASRLVDYGAGEGGAQLRRLEWFYSTRRAGIRSEDERARLRSEALAKTRALIAKQRARRAVGIDAEVNYWVAMGPSPSHFGGWSFGDVSGRLAALAMDWDREILYVGAASGGIWKSTNDGLSYVPIFESSGALAAGALAVDPNDPDRVWVGTGDNVTGCEGYFGNGLLLSTDGGTSWEPRNGSEGQDLDDLSSFANVIVDPRDSDHLVVGGRIRGCSAGQEASGGLFTSDDGGLTWTERISNTSIYEIAQDPIVLDVYWAATAQGVYKSTDNGVSWVQQTASGLPSSNTGRTELAVSPSDSNTVYVLFADPQAFWRTTDGGASWSEMSTGSEACDGQCWYNATLRVHRTDPDTVYRGSIRLYKSTNGGADWTDLVGGWGGSQKVHQDMHVLLMHPDEPETFYIGSDGGLWKSTDGGANFTNLNADLSITQFYAVGVDAQDTNVICGGSQDNSSLVRTSGDVWELQAVTGDGFVCHINPQDPSYAYIASYPSGGRPNVLRSTSGVLGSFYGITGSGSGIGADRSNWVTPYLLDPQSPNILYLGTYRVYRSDDHGSNWTQVGPADMTGGSGTVLSLDINRNETDVLLAGTTSGYVWRTTDAGDDWEDITFGLPSRSINDVASDPTNRDRAFAVVGGFNTAHLWEWNAGSGWVARGADLPNVPANTVLMLTDNDILVGTDVGIFRSADGGQTFEPYQQGTPEGLVVTDLKVVLDKSIVTAGTYGRGAWQVSIDPVEPILLFDSIEQPLVEIDGDGDANVEPGETWSVRPILRNGGGETALGVSARLATSTPGATIVSPDVREYGDIHSGQTGAAVESYDFIVDPDFPCGDEIVFDLVEIRSTNAPGTYPDRPAAFRVTVVDAYEEPTVTTLFDEDFESGAPGWSHEAYDVTSPWQCYGQYYRDEWQLISKDAEHGTSYHCGAGPGGNYSRTNNAWLYAFGKDSEDGPGLVIPGDATTVSLALDHWYDTEHPEDGAQVVIDAVLDDNDDYVALKPDGGYPGDPLATGNCNSLEGRSTFSGSSGGWVTHTFDMTAYRGKTVYLAFVFGSDTNKSYVEGWYIDRVLIESRLQGDPICQVTGWPGSVPATASFRALPDGDIEATWEASCNESDLPGQLYSIHAGSLEQLAAGGYDHAVLDARCDRLSPEIFTPGEGQSYYLIVPNHGGHEGGAGTGSGGLTRPQLDGTCGLPREGACP